MNTRTANLIVGTSGGTAGGNATNYKLALPSTWIKEMGLTPEQRQMELRFDGTSITITKKLSFAEFLKLPFGNNPSPSWADYQHFLEDRCIPKTRAGLQEYLEAIGVDSYEPLEIIRKTQGRMAEDDLWLTVEELK